MHGGVSQWRRDFGVQQWFVEPGKQDRRSYPVLLAEMRLPKAFSGCCRVRVVEVSDGRAVIGW